MCCPFCVVRQKFILTILHFYSTISSVSLMLAARPRRLFVAPTVSSLLFVVLIDFLKIMLYTVDRGVASLRVDSFI